LTQAADTILVADGQRAVKSSSGADAAVATDEGVASVYSARPGALRSTPCCGHRREASVDYGP